MSQKLNGNKPSCCRKLIFDEDVSSEEETTQQNPKQENGMDGKERDEHKRKKQENENEENDEDGSGHEDSDIEVCRRRGNRQRVALQGAEEARWDNIHNDLWEKLKNDNALARERWNFDFELEQPLEGDWEWERVDNSGRNHSNVNPSSDDSKDEEIHSL